MFLGIGGLPPPDDGASGAGSNRISISSFDGIVGPGDDPTFIPVLDAFSFDDASDLMRQRFLREHSFAVSGHAVTVMANERHSFNSDYEKLSDDLDRAREILDTLGQRRISELMFLIQEDLFLVQSIFSSSEDFDANDLLQVRTSLMNKMTRLRIVVDEPGIFMSINPEEQRLEYSRIDFSGLVRCLDLEISAFFLHISETEEARTFNWEESLRDFYLEAADNYYDSSLAIFRLFRERGIPSNQSVLHLPQVMPDDPRQLLTVLKNKVDIALEAIDRNRTVLHQSITQIDPFFINPDERNFLVKEFDELRNSQAEIIDLQRQYIAIADHLLTQTDSSDFDSILMEIQQRAELYRWTIEMEESAMYQLNDQRTHIESSRDSIQTMAGFLERVLSRFEQNLPQNNDQLRALQQILQRIVNRYHLTRDIYRTLLIDDIYESRGILGQMEQDHAELLNAVENEETPFNTLREVRRVHQNFLASIYMFLYEIRLDSETDFDVELIESRYELALVLSVPQISEDAIFIINHEALFRHFYRVLNMLNQDISRLELSISTMHNGSDHEGMRRLEYRRSILQERIDNAEVLIQTMRILTSEGNRDDVESRYHTLESEQARQDLNRLNSQLDDFERGLRRENASIEYTGISGSEERILPSFIYANRDDAESIVGGDLFDSSNRFISSLSGPRELIERYEGFTREIQELISARQGVTLNLEGFLSRHVLSNERFLDSIIRDALIGHLGGNRTRYANDINRLRGSAWINDLTIIAINQLQRNDSINFEDIRRVTREVALQGLRQSSRPATAGRELLQISRVEELQRARSRIADPNNDSLTFWRGIIDRYSRRGP